MKTARETRQEITELTDKQKVILDAVEQSEERKFTDEQRQQLKDLDGKIERLKKDLQDAEIRERAQERVAAMSGGNPADNSKRSGEDIDNMSQFKWSRFLHHLHMNRNLEGVELEVHQEAVKEARERNSSLKGFGLPSDFFRILSSEDRQKEDRMREQRDLVVGTATAGGNLVATQQMPMIPALRPTPQIVAAGAQVLNNLVGDVDIPKQTGIAQAAWAGETASAAETDPTFGVVQMSPKRAAAFVDLGIQLIAQSSEDVQRLIMRDLEFAFALLLDQAGINGSGAGNVPEGILNATDINTVEIGTNGGALTWAKVVEFLTSVEQSNAPINMPTWLTTPGVKGHAATTEKSANTAKYLSEDGRNLYGMPMLTSTQVPSNLTKGTSVNVCHAAILGDFSQMILGNWGVIDISVGNHRAKEGIREFVINALADVGIRNEESFAVCTDITPN